MGVVYEAEQQSLGRQVALKVLPHSATRDSMRLRRFRREARSAARLHHTNIVPVHEGGDAQGIHYYAMQFIEGQSLDEILLELRRARKKAPIAPSGEDGVEERSNTNLTSQLASGLATGQFATVATGAVQSEVSPAGPSRSEEPVADRIVTDTHVDVSASSSALRDKSSELSDPSQTHYYRSVARIGLQIAEALGYAHTQKVLHRDIKPSNLLLELQGAVWVTDFGLATEEGQDLTQTGDLVGTLRYMAPERFSGLCDPRADIYSLGLTLYELLTLQPAFKESDRGQL